MCGIAGILDPTGVGQPPIRRMADTLAHRGPDDASIHLEPGLGLGFRRLSIIDLEGGGQPIANEDGSVLVVYNGEIYNFRELRDQLQRRGHEFSTHCDTEVLVHLYEERGADLVHALRGMFAFAIWDRRRRQLLLARDHLGQKPLFWARKDSRFWFASEIKAILAAEPSFRTLNAKALHEYLTLRIVSEPRSMFKGIRKLAPGHLLRVEEEGSQESHRYWNLSYEPKQQVSEEEALERLDETLRDTVRLHLVSDVEVGAFLSGGIDSGLTTAVMATHQERPIKTFSLGMPYGDYDEAPPAARVAERYGTDHHVDRIGGNVIERLPRVVYHLDEPSDPLSVCMDYLAEMTSAKVKVAVGGDGGDELFGGYDRYYGTRFARYYGLLPSSIREFVRRRIFEIIPDGFWYKSWSHKLQWLDELASVDAGENYARSLSYFYFTPQYRDRLYTGHFSSVLGDFDPEEVLTRWQADEAAKEELDTMLLADSMVRLPNHSVMILDRTTMAHGLEARSPFLDSRFAEFAATLPVHLKVQGRKRRYLQMRLARRYLPPEVIQRPKQGFSSPLPYLMGRQFKALFDHYLPQSHLVEAGLLRRPAIQKLVDEHVSGETDHGKRLWLLLNVEMWHRIHIEEMTVDRMTDEVRGILDLEPAAIGEPSVCLS